jgi:hypothetical protein
VISLHQSPEIQEGIARWKKHCRVCPHHGDGKRPTCAIADAHWSGHAQDIARENACPAYKFPGQVRPSGDPSQRPAIVEDPGHAGWAKLHKWALAKPAPDPQWFAGFADGIGCGACRMDFLKLLNANPPRYGAECFDWSVEIHNAVNAKLGKPTVTVEQARRRWDGIGRCFVISLERTPDRLDAFKNRFPAVWPFPDVETLPAVDGLKEPVRAGWIAGGPAFGLCLTWVRLLERLIADGVDKPVMVLEDDCEFAASSVALQDFVASIPDDADLAFVGGQHFQPPSFVLPGVERVAEAGRTHCMIVFPRYFKPLLDFFTSGCQDHIDHCFQGAAKHHNYYSASPFLAIQTANFSTIRYRFEPSRSWDNRVPVAVRSPAAVRVVVLKADKATVDRLRDASKIHSGYWRNDQGIDNGLVALMNKPEPVRAGAFRAWLRLLLGETAAFPDAVLAVVHPDISGEMASRWAGRTIEEVGSL